jgi:hypothetical protein
MALLASALMIDFFPANFVENSLQMISKKNHKKVAIQKWRRDITMSKSYRQDDHIDGSGGGGLRIA